MISFEPEIQDDPDAGFLQRWAETPSGRVRCRASYSFLQDRTGVSDRKELLAGAAQGFEDLKPLYEDAIKRADFAHGKIKTIEFS